MFETKSDWAPVLVGVPQGNVQCPLLISFPINDISDAESEILARKWDMILQVFKCTTMQMTKNVLIKSRLRVHFRVQA